jgi:hypothetical protein
MTSVAIYHSSIPNKKNQEKVDVLKNFSIGAKLNQDIVTDITNYNIINTDVAVIQGWVAPGPPLTPHGDLRSRVIKYQTSRSKFVVGIDSNLFLYANTNNPLHYLRYSFNGIFPSTGIYCDREIDPSRWTRISKNLKVTLKDYRTNGNHILICAQRNKGWAMGRTDVQEWIIQTIAEIKKHTNRPIVVRLHPGDKETRRIFKAGPPLCRVKFDYSVTLSHNENLLDDLKNCWAAVNYNSSPVVGAAIEGIPIFVMDPTNSQCKDIANTNLAMIENPAMPNRQLWVERLSMFHWNFDELKSGECWLHMKKYII